MNFRLKAFNVLIQTWLKTLFNSLRFTTITTTRKKSYWIIRCQMIMSKTSSQMQNKFLINLLYHLQKSWMINLFIKDQMSTRAAWTQTFFIQLIKIKASWNLIHFKEVLINTMIQDISKRMKFKETNLHS